MPSFKDQTSDLGRLAIRREDENRRVLLVFGAALIVRLMHIWSLKVSPIFSYKIGDAAKYDAWAQSIAGGNWLGDGVFYQAPLYPYFLGIIYSTLGDSLLTVRLVQSLIGAISCVLIMLAASNLFGKRSGLVSGLCLAFYAPSIFLEGLIQKSTLDLFFLCLLLWLISKIVYRPRPSLWVWAGLATGALCLTRENALILIPIFLLWIFIGAFRFGRCQLSKLNESNSGATHFRLRAGWLMGFGLGVAMTLGPVAVRNYMVGGQFHLTTSQLGPNFYIGNNPDSNGTYRPLRPGRGDAKFEQRDAVDLAEKEMGKSLSPKEVSQYYLAQSFEFIRQQPWQWCQLLGLKFGLAFNRHEVIDTEDQYTVARLSPVLSLTELVFNFGVLTPLAFLGMFVTRARWKRLWVIYVIMIAFALTLVAFFVFGRYRFPLVPPMMLFLGPACISLSRIFQSNKRIQIAGTVAALVLVIAACNLRLVATDNAQAITLSNYGVQALIRNDYENAERFLEASARQLPESALVHNNIAVLYRETGRTDLAFQHFQRALKLEPEDDTIRRNFDSLMKKLAK